MKWVKKGLIYVPEGKYGFDVTHCHKPTPCLIIMFYNGNGFGRTGFGYATCSEE